MSLIYDTFTLGTPNNLVTFNDYSQSQSTIFRVRSRFPNRRSITDFDIKLPEVDGIADFQTLMGKEFYTIEGVMYPPDETAFHVGRRALRKLASVSIEQADSYSDNGYVPLKWTEENGASRQLFVKVLYVDMKETTRNGIVQEFTLFCKIKYPVILDQQVKSVTLSSASTPGTSISTGAFIPSMIPMTIGSNLGIATITSSSNLIANPSFEVDTSLWSYVGTAAPTITRDTTQAFSGSASMKFAKSANNQSPAYTMSLTAGQQYTASAYVMAVSGSYNVRLETFNAGNIGASAAITSTGWTRVTLTFTGNASFLNDQLILTSTAGGATAQFYVDAVQLETGATASAYFDGSTTATSTSTYSWTGTPHLSASLLLTRTGGSILPLVLPAVLGGKSSVISSTLTAAGDYPTYPTIVIYGPVNKPRVTNVSTGEYVEFDISLGTSDSIIITYDQDSLTVTGPQGTNVYGKRTDGSTFWRIKPGTVNLSFTGAQLGIGSYATINFNDAWPLS